MSYDVQPYTLEKTEVISRLCKLLGEVADRKFAWHYASDCICTEKQDSGFLGTDGVDEQVLKFVENAVMSALENQ